MQAIISNCEPASTIRSGSDLDVALRACGGRGASLFQVTGIPLAPPDESVSVATKARLQRYACQTSVAWTDPSRRYPIQTQPPSEHRKRRGI